MTLCTEFHRGRSYQKREHRKRYLNRNYDFRKMRFVNTVPLKYANSTEYDRDDSYVCCARSVLVVSAERYCFEKRKMNENFQMIGQGGWDVYVTGANGFVGKEPGVTKVRDF